MAVTATIAASTFLVAGPIGTALGVRTAGEWIVLIAAVLVALGVIHRYVVRPLVVGFRKLSDVIDRLQDLIDQYPRVREMVQAIVDKDLPQIEARLAEIEKAGSRTADVLEAAVDPNPTPGRGQQAIERPPFRTTDITD